MSTSRTVDQLVMLAAAAFLASSLSGCATLLSESSYPVTIDNKGGPTYFSVYDRKNRVVQSGVTPQQVTLKAKAAPFWPAKYKVAYAAQDGVQDYDLKAGFDWFTAGNVVVGGVPGIVVDGASGAMWKLQPTVTGHVARSQLISNASQGSSVLTAWSTEGSPPGTPHQSSGSVRMAGFERDGTHDDSGGIQQVSVEF